MSFQCQECHKIFTTRSGLTGHLQTHKVVKRIVLGPCKICNTEFDTHVRRKNGQYTTKETCSDSCHILLRILRATASKKPDVIALGSKTHGNKFDYSRTVYVDSKTPIVVGCPVHGFVEVSIYGHLKKYGCPKCGGEVKTKAFIDHVLNAPGGKISKQETVWLDQLNVIERQYKASTTVRSILVDGYDPETNTVYLFHGVFWHGHPDHFPSDDIHPIKKVTYGELYEKTLFEEGLLREAGYNVVTKWG